MSFGPPPSVCTESTLAAENRRKRHRLFAFEAAAIVLAVLCAGIWALSYDDTGTASDQRPAAVSQAPDAIQETVERRPATPEGAISSAEPRASRRGGTSRRRARSPN